MNKRVIITECDLHRIIKESINNILKENKVNNGILYHQLPFNKKHLQDILTNGLKPHDNGESNCIWFCKNEPFYQSHPNTVTLTVEFNQKFTAKHSYVDDVSIVRVFDKVKPKELTIKECPFCINTDTNEVLLNLSNVIALKKWQ